MSNDMNAFVRVVEKGSFAAAAQDLGLSPSAVSKIVTRIEERLGVQLLTRTTRRIALTPEGDTYFQRCRDILAAIEAAEAEVSSSGSSLQGPIRISASTSIGHHARPPNARSSGGDSGASGNTNRTSRGTARTRCKATKSSPGAP